MTGRKRPVAPPLALGPEEAAAAIGVSRTFFDAQVLPEVKAVRRGRRILVPVSELEAWLSRNKRDTL